MTRPPHPIRCWAGDGHERCALRDAALVADNRARWNAARTRMFRGYLADLDRGLPTTDLPPGVLDAARHMLGAAPDTTITRHGAR